MEKKRVKWKDLGPREKRKILIIFSTILALSILGILYSDFMKSQPQDYTIGTIDKVWNPVKGGAQVAYTYWVNGKEFKGSVNRYGFEQIAKPGRKFIVEYPEQYHWEGILNLKLPVSDSLKAPASGWDELPILNVK
ncbi:MAG: hypothetical protein KI791_11445 [Cyclobacteriaceae bacterium]|nr:hypothetical protein [Cyclobacteriaceae bacterium SS2]